MSLTIETSPLYQDITDIIKQPKEKYSSGFNCEVKVHTVDKDLDYRDGVVVNTIKIFRDYVGRMSDYIEIELSVLLGTYVYDIYPYLTNMEVSLYLTRQSYVDGSPVNIEERYKAIFLVEKNTSIPTKTSLSKDNLNQNLPIVLTLQLLDRSSETLRIKTLQGSFDKIINPKNKDMKPEVFLKSLISEHVNKVLVENKPAIDKLSIETVDNLTSLKSITIPSGTRLVELSDYLQTKSSGLYNGGVGTYIQRFASSLSETDKVFFVYSLFKASKYHKSEYKTIFYSPPTSNQSITDVTYKYKEKTLKVVTHTTNKILDNKETLVMSTGSGYRSSNANSFMKKPVEITPEGPKFTNSHLNTEIVYKEREDGLNFSPNRGISSNHFQMNSEVLAKSGKYVPLRVSNLDMDFIYPGAPCKVVFESIDNPIEELYGVIHRAMIVLAQPAMNMTHMFSSPTVTLNSQIDLEIFVTGE